MLYFYNPYILASAIVLAICLVLVYYSWKNRSVAKAKVLLVILALAIVWIAAQALEFSAVDLQTKIFWADVQYVSILLMPVAYLVLTLQHTQKTKWLYKHWVRAALGAVPIIFLALLWTNSMHELIRQDITLDTSGVFPTVGKTFGGIFWIFAGYNFFLTFLSLSLLVRSALYAQYPYKEQSLLLACSLLLPVTTTALHVSGVLPLLFDLTPLMFGVSGMLVTFTIFYYRLFHVVPITHSMIIDNMTTVVIVADETLHIADINQEALNLFGQQRKEIIGIDAHSLFKDYPQLLKLISHKTNQRIEIAFEASVKQYYEFSSSMLVNTRNDAIGRLLLGYNITQRRQAEEALRISEATMSSAFDYATIGMAFVALDGRFMKVNRALQNILGYSEKELQLKTFHEITHPDDLQADVELAQQLFAGKIDTYQLEKRYFHKHGHTIWVMLSGSLIHDTQGEPLYYIAQIQDITERKRTEDNLRSSEEQFRLFAESAPVGVLITDKQKRTIFISQRFTEMLGYTMEEIPTLEHWLQRAYTDDQQKEQVKSLWMQSPAEAQEDYTSVRQVVSPVRCKRGAILHIDIRIASTENFHFVIFSNVTEQYKLEQQLIHSQKMESIGRLAGGIAHDFNNMLMVILGRAEIAKELCDQQHPAIDEINEIIEAATHSVLLTKQLLAFSRQQVIKPIYLDINETIDFRLNMLRRLIGEDIDLQWIPCDQPVMIRMDPSQVDQVLTNLCINSRDAISGTGKIVIETAYATVTSQQQDMSEEIKPGNYALLVITDNGCGMDRETQKMIFEPFFTTKKVGEGTGLGLPTVYGIVKQNHGFIHVSSDVGKGTSVTVYIPSNVEEAREHIEYPEAPTITSSSHAVVLVVEDNPSMLSITRTMLERLSYEVLSAADSAEALQIAEEYQEGSIDLLLSDVIMPGMDGKQLAQKISSIYPDLQVLFMSGYPKDIIAERGVLYEGIDLILKPFTIEQLSAKLHEMLPKA